MAVVCHCRETCCWRHQELHAAHTHEVVSIGYHHPDIHGTSVSSAVDAQPSVACVQTWKRICEASRNEFYAIYERLDVRLLWRGESFYNPQLRPLVEELQERGIAEESQGALVRSPALSIPALASK